MMVITDIFTDDATTFMAFMSQVISNYKHMYPLHNIHVLCNV